MYSDVINIIFHTKEHDYKFLQITRPVYTVVPFLKDTLYKGHPSIKDTNFWQQLL